MNNNYENKFDCDPADCAGYRTDSDNNAETSEDSGVGSTTDFPDIPGEYGNAETSAEFGTGNDADAVFKTPDVIAPIAPDVMPFASIKNNKTTDLNELYADEDRYDAETSAEFGNDEYTRPNSDGAVCDNGCGNGCGCGDDCDCPDGTCESGYDNDFTGDPDDETAATTDEWHERHCDCADERTTCAQERCKLDDYEIISDVLGCEKQLVKLYSTALCESAEDGLRNVIRENLIECANDQYATFEYMDTHGLYPTEQAQEEQIVQAKQQFTPLCDNNN